MKKRICFMAMICLSLSLLSACGASAGEPPVLQVNGMEEALRGSYNWNTESLLSGRMGVSSDAPHPLDRVESMPVVIYPEDGEISLSWKIEPDSVSVRYWTSEFLNEDAALESEVAAITADYDGSVFTLPQEGLPCVVDVHAEWGDGILKTSSGACGYCFLVVFED